MKISVGKTPEGAIVLAFDGTQVSLNMAETKVLLLELTKVLLPQGAAIAPNPGAKAEALAGRIKGANDLGIQKLLRVADHDDLLVLLKYGEKDAALTNKIYGNMTAKSRKIYAEDMAYRFKEGLPEDLLGKATSRLSAAVRDLEGEGAL